MPDEQLPSALSQREVALVKDVLLRAAATGALSGAATISLAESLIAAFALVSQAANCPAPMNVPATATGGLKGDGCMTAPPSSLPLPERLAIARLWLLARRVPASKQIAMGADRWQSEPTAEQRMQAAVAAALRELADCVEQQGVQLGLAQALLLDQVPDQKAQ